ncbi:hypothetical protein J6590_049678 [Homalodisca vitripennis]|nr:hypothetical protein J6590_049678 [Homalodisca vitripennis]
MSRLIGVIITVQEVDTNGAEVTSMVINCDDDDDGSAIGDDDSGDDDVTGRHHLSVYRIQWDSNCSILLSADQDGRQIAPRSIDTHNVNQGETLSRLLRSAALFCIKIELVKVTSKLVEEGCRPNNPTVVLAGDPTVVLAGDPTVVLAGDPTVVLAGDPTVVLAGDPTVVLAGDLTVVQVDQSDKQKHPGVPTMGNTCGATT